MKQGKQFNLLICVWLMCLVSGCGSTLEFLEHTFVPLKKPELVEIADTFTVEGITFPTNPETYEDIVAMVETMVEEDILSITVPYRGDFMSPELYPSYEYAYEQAYVQVNTTHIEHTSNTSTYVIGYRTIASGEQFIFLTRSDKDFTNEEILMQNQVYREEIAKLTQELLDSGRVSKEMPELEQIKEVYLFVTEYLEYCYDYLNTPLAYTAYGAVTERKSVCQGYVALFNGLLKALGFEVEGEAGVVGIGLYAMDEAHIWSRVKLGDTWHYFDPTFGDKSTFSSEKGDLSYNMDYFDIPYEAIVRDRSTNRYGVNNSTLQPSA